MRRVPLVASTFRMVIPAAIAVAPRRPFRHETSTPIARAIARAATATPNVTRKNPTKRTVRMVTAASDRGVPRQAGFRSRHGAARSRRSRCAGRQPRDRLRARRLTFRPTLRPDSPRWSALAGARRSGVRGRTSGTGSPPSASLRPTSSRSARSTVPPTSRPTRRASRRGSPCPSTGSASGTRTPCCTRSVTRHRAGEDGVTSTRSPTPSEGVRVAAVV